MPVCQLCNRTSTSIVLIEVDFCVTDPETFAPLWYVFVSCSLRHKEGLHVVVMLSEVMEVHEVFSDKHPVQHP